MTDGLSILCTGDLHLGRHPSRIPSDIDGGRFSPRAIWRSTARAAIDRSVDAVVIAGDIVDRENRYFEAYGAFEEGARRLDDAGIPIVAVAGNHDFDVLPRLAEELDLEALHVLGENGRWKRRTIEGETGPLVHVDGWSFPDERVPNSPFEDYDLPAARDAPLIGLLHGDLEASGSRYAPVRIGDLRGTPANAWVLGHIHRPTTHDDGEPLVIYPGSPQPLDPGERGSHGPWLLSIDPAGTVEAEQLALATVRYERLDVPVDGVDDPKAVPAVVSDRIDDRLRSAVGSGALELVLLRVRLTGRTGAHAAIVDRRDAIEEQLAFATGSVSVRIERLDVDTKPAVDLDDLARGEGPVAYLADLLGALERGETDGDRARLIADAQAAMRRARRSRAYELLRRENRGGPVDEEAAVAMLEREARILLDTLLEQKEEPP